MNDPVTFLMPVASPAPFLAETLSSVVSQTFESWRLTVVIDGADDSIKSLVGRLVPADRLTVVTLPQRGGISRALNMGLEATETEWVARIDADDRNLPHRLETQMEFVTRHPDTVLVGAGARLISAGGDHRGNRDVVPGWDVRRALVVRNRIIHSTALFRRRDVIAVGGYNARCFLREDYELWLRLSTQGRIANLEERLVEYRLSPGQSSRRPAPASSLRYVSAARRDACAVLGVSRPRAMILDLAWRAAQQPPMQAALSGARRA